MGTGFTISIVIVWVVAVSTSVMMGVVTSSIFMGVIYFIYSGFLAYAYTAYVIDVTRSFISL